ncbi:MAG TPA: zinc-dependent alcohol dehydrogenase family protein [Solirubrobacteraceae bacterium]|jgi:propanol-preferring alcohol dehydrogenase|nr:zinc-dependent alcohol dehydrogenase family protein [Solirubrobacteraceae bacterium]
MIGPVQVMELPRPGEPLRAAQRADPEPPTRRDVLLDVHACGVCRTDLHIVDGEVRAQRYPVVPGHQIVATVLDAGPEAEVEPGARVGVPWLGWVDGTCRFCTSGRENLCLEARFTGLDREGGYAQRAVADARFVLPLPDGYTDLQVAPLLCAGLIGFRSYRLTGDAERLGLYGFGSSAHIIAQVAVWEGRRVFAFTSPGDAETQAFARSLGAEWAGGSDEAPPEPLDAAIIFAPVGPLVPAALRALDRGGVVVCAGIHMSDIPSFPYELLWEERSVRSVANLTRQDGTDFLAQAPEVPVRTTVTEYALADANTALEDLRHGRLEGAAVILPPR